MSNKRRRMMTRVAGLLMIGLFMGQAQSGWAQSAQDPTIDIMEKLRPLADKTSQ